MSEGTPNELVVEIRSFVLGGNHGQFFQALGLQLALSEILPGAVVAHSRYHNHRFKELFAHVRGGTLPKYAAMQYHWKQALNFLPTNLQPDVTIYGSDMIWHLESKLFPRDPFFFGAGDVAKYSLAYAPSVGSQDITPSLAGLNNFFSRLSCIGVRDIPTQTFVEEISGRQSELVMDPAFFLMPHVVPELPTTTVPISESHPIRIAAYTPNHAVQKRLRLKPPVRFSGYWPRAQIVTSFADQMRNPVNVLRQVLDCDLLITSTFHGVVMALMTNTPFVAIMSPSLIARLNGPISSLFAASRCVSVSDFVQLEDEQIRAFCDTSDLSPNKLGSLVRQSRKWLEQSLSDL